MSEWYEAYYGDVYGDEDGFTDSVKLPAPLPLVQLPIQVPGSPCYPSHVYKKSEPTEKVVFPKFTHKVSFYGVECPCGFLLEKDNDYCSVCLQGGLVPDDLLRKLPAEARKIFAPPSVPHLCGPCYRGQNISFDDGKLTQVICGPCRTELADLDIYKCKCGNHRFIHPHGTVAKYC